MNTVKEFVEKLIERLEEETYSWNDGYRNGMKGAIAIVNQLAEEYNSNLSEKLTGWIPCSERLPEEEADVLLSLRNLDVYTGFRANTKGCFYADGEGYVEFENVIAWQPLPDPYKPEQQKEKVMICNKCNCKKECGWYESYLKIENEVYLGVGTDNTLGRALLAVLRDNELKQCEYFEQ